jgi:polysaccharide export outer membrane protein
MISVFVEGQRELTGDFTLDESGTYGQPVVGRITVGGLTPAAAEKKVADALEGRVVNPRVTVSVIHRVVSVSVSGEVNAPGVFSVQAGENVLQALARAGGLTSFAHKDRIFVMGPTLPTRVRLDYKLLVEGDPKSLGFTLRDGDIVVVE